MKIKNYLFVFFAVCGFVIIQSCGSDTVTGGNNTGGSGYTIDTLLYSIDSIRDNGGDSSVVHAPMQIDSNTSGLRLMFNGYTNAVNGVVVITCVDNAGEFYRFEKIGTALNGTFDLLVDCRNNPGLIGLHFFVYCNSPNSTEFVRLQNIKVQKITYTN